MARGQHEEHNPARRVDPLTWVQPSDDPGAVPSRHGFNDDTGWSASVRQLGTRPLSKQAGPDRGHFAVSVWADDRHIAETRFSTMRRGQIAASAITRRGQ